MQNLRSKNEELVLDRNNLIQLVEKLRNENEGLKDTVER